MSQQGWIKAHRSIQEHWLWKEKPFSKGQAWIDLLLLANHKGNKISIGNNLIEIDRGQFITSEIKLSQRWGWSRKKVRSFLSVLERDKMLTKKATTQYTTITIENYDFYQSVGATEEQQKNSGGTTEEQRRNTNKNDKNVKNDKNKIINNYTSNPKLIEAINDLFEMRKAAKKPMTEKAIKLLLNKLDKLADTDEKKIALLEQSIERGWLSVFPLKDEKEKQKGIGSTRTFNNFKSRDYKPGELEEKLKNKAKTGMPSKDEINRELERLMEERRKMKGEQQA